MSEREHGQQRRIACLISKVILELAACQLRAGCRFRSDKTGLLSFQDIVTHEGEGDAAEVGTSAEATDHHIGILTCQLHLLLGFQTDDSLMQGDMAQDGTERVFAVGCHACQLDGFGDGSTQ